MEGMTVFKRIKNFNVYKQKQKTSLAAIREAYAVAQRAADVAKRDGLSQCLVTCTSPPTVVRKQYRVRTLPCGYSSRVISEKVSYVESSLDPWKSCAAPLAVTVGMGKIEQICMARLSR